MLFHQYEMFKMNNNKPINEMTTHFMHIINQLKALGKLYTNVEMFKKILESLTKVW